MEEQTLYQIKLVIKSSCMFYFILICFLVLLMIIETDAAADSESFVVNTLPGYPGTLPFVLETGYINVGENDEEEMQMFYYFVESERDPIRDPLLFWITGGPGCTGFSTLVYEVGPLAFDIEAFNGSLPSFVLNPYSWTKIASIIFIDSPVGTGFSYATTPQSYLTSDTKIAKHNYAFLRKWLLNHPTFIKNRLYVAGESYGGKFAPMVALEIAQANEAGLEPQMMLQGYLVGNSRTDGKKDSNERIPFAHRMALISDNDFELAKSSCKGDFVSPDPNNYQCHYALQLIKQCTDLINEPHILEPKCKFLSPKPDHRLGSLFPEDVPGDFILLSKQEEPHCRVHNYVTSYIWANDETVQEALHVRKGTIADWRRCNSTLKSYSYTEDLESIQSFHQLLNNKGYRALAYSGDHDMVVPHMSTLKWIRELNLTLDEPWRPWIVDGQVAGYMETYKNKDAYITFATIKGAGHTAPEYKPKESFAMIKRWLSLKPL